MANKKIVTKKDISDFNTFREKYQAKEMSGTEMMQALKKELGYPAHNMMLRALCDGENSPIIKVKRGRYCVNSKPVFIERLQTAFDAYTRFANPRHYKTEKYEEEISISKAIAVLKNAGYKVLKPVTQYEEC